MVGETTNAGRRDLAFHCLRSAIAWQCTADRGYPLVTVATRVAELGEADLALAALNSAEPGAATPAEWFALTAIVHAILGRRDEVLRLASRVEHEDPASVVGRGSLAFAFEYIDEPGRADALLALLAPSGNAYEIVHVAQIALAAGRVARAEGLASRVSPEECPRLVEVRLQLARTHASAGDAVAAHAWLDRAAKMVRPPKYFQPNLAIALTAVTLGEVARARALADAVDLATQTRIARYGDSEHIELAEVYAALGEQTKVDEILAGFARVHATATARGFASTARAYARLGRIEEARTFANKAEAKRGKRDDSVRLVLMRAYIELGDFLRAVHHARHITDEMHAEALLEIARIAKSRSVEMTPELEAEL
jgi:tetratricopeptide (TPR) repeat protein